MKPTIELTKIDKFNAEERMNFYPVVFKDYWVMVENAITNLAGQYSNDYSGGFWEFVSCKVEGYEEHKLGFMYPACDTLKVTNPANWFDDEMSGEAFGLALTLYFASNMSFYAYEHGDSKMTEVMTELYHGLREVAKQHSEAGAILGFID